MTARLITTLDHIEKRILNQENRDLVSRFHQFMKKNGTSERYQNNNLKTILAYSEFLGASIPLSQINKKEEIIAFLDTKVKATELDPDKRWITTWNDYLGRIKFFFRWMYNYDRQHLDEVQFSLWETPEFVRIKKRKRKSCGLRQRILQFSVYSRYQIPYKESCKRSYFEFTVNRSDNI